MGGEYCLAIRTSDGKEQVSLRWTNDIPLLIHFPGFLEEDPSVVNTVITEAKEHNQWPNSRLVKCVTGSEYGVILVDFMTKTIFSRQDYCDIEWFGTHYPVYAEDLEILNYNILTNSILEVTDYLGAKFTVNEAKNWIKDKSENLVYKRFKLALPFKVDHENESSNIAGEVKKFMKDNNWKSKTRFRKED